VRGHNAELENALNAGVEDEKLLYIYIYTLFRIKCSKDIKTHAHTVIRKREIKEIHAHENTRSSAKQRDQRGYIHLVVFQLVSRLHRLSVILSLTSIIPLPIRHILI